MLYNYPEVGDKEVVGSISSAVAYGNVRQVFNSIGTVLDTMGSSPRRYLLECTHTDFQYDLDGFVHRFATGRHLAAMLAGIKGVLETYGTLQDGFAAGVEKADANYLPALGRFAGAIRSNCGQTDPGHLIDHLERAVHASAFSCFLGG